MRSIELSSILWESVKCVDQRKEPTRVLGVVKETLRQDQKVFVGAIDVLDAKGKSPEEVRDRVSMAAEYSPTAKLGTCDDRGFFPFCDGKWLAFE